MSYDNTYQHNWDLTNEISEDSARFASMLDSHVAEATSDYNNLGSRWHSDAGETFIGGPLRKAHDKVKHAQTAIVAHSRATAHASELAHGAEKKNLNTALSI